MWWIIFFVITKQITDLVLQKFKNENPGLYQIRAMNII